MLLQNLPTDSAARFERVWDLGCGTGLCGSLIRPRADHLVGVDLSSAMVAKARALGVYNSLHALELVDFLKQGTEQADLVLAVPETSPVALAQTLMQGQRPQVDIQGDVQLAAEVAWLVDNVRWDVEEDLSRVVGDATAHTLVRFARSAAQGIKGFADRMPRPPGGPAA